MSSQALLVGPQLQVWEARPADPLSLLVLSDSDSGYSIRGKFLQICFNKINKYKKQSKKKKKRNNIQLKKIIILFFLDFIFFFLSPSFLIFPSVLKQGL